MTAALNRGELFASFDIDAFEVPHGRDELWRFTPLRRLRGLHDGSAPRSAGGWASSGPRLSSLPLPPRSSGRTG